MLLGRAGRSRRAHRGRRRGAASSSGEGFAIAASYGVVALPDEAADADRALQLADQRMYAHKGGARTSPRRAERATCCCRCSSEREPDAARAPRRRRALALAVGRARSGLAREELDEIARAAELHDIGKIAIPDAILDKPGPLDDGEWAFMRQHTIVGERILAAAPALRPVARLVRASHERWDGAGYPDGLAGDARSRSARAIIARLRRL